MCEKIRVWLNTLAVAIFITGLLADTVVNDAKETKIIKENPLIIDTVLNNYDNPTIDEYYQCVKRRDNCLERCTFSGADCKSKCPICPVLYNHDVLVQGINDTEYRASSLSGSTNQTNIIRIINEIRNIIDTKLGNISTNSQNLFNIYQNLSSKTGGKYGLGYNEKGPCCHIIEPKRCRRSERGFNCAPRHQLTCGSHCISRVMRTRRVVSCNDINPNDCSSIREYIPERRRPGCHYISKYPFIECATNQVPKATSCNKCFNIPYIHVVRGQVPRDCFRCYSHSNVHHRRPLYPFPNFYRYPSAYQPAPYYPPTYESPVYDYSFDDNWLPEENEFIEPATNFQDETKPKCNESSAEGCEEANKNEDEIEIHKDISPDDNQDNENGDDYYDDNNSD